MVAKMKALCEERGLNFAKLERMADIGNGSLDNWDEHVPRLGTLDKVARALDMPLVDLIDYLGWSAYPRSHDNRRRRTKTTA